MNNYQKYKDYYKNYYQKNKERKLAYANAYNETHKEERKIREKNRRSNPNNRLRQQNYELKHLYGITIDQKQEMFEKQNGKCANLKCGYIFKNLGDSNVDHNHLTKKVRGLLCDHCNRGIGQFKDNKEIILSIIKYLETNDV